MLSVVPPRPTGSPGGKASPARGRSRVASRESPFAFSRTGPGVRLDARKRGLAAPSRLRRTPPKTRATPSPGGDLVAARSSPRSAATLGEVAPWAGGGKTVASRRSSDPPPGYAVLPPRLGLRPRRGETLLLQGPPPGAQRQGPPPRPSVSEGVWGRWPPGPEGVRRSRQGEVAHRAGGGKQPSAISNQPSAISHQPKARGGWRVPSPGSPTPDAKRRPLPSGGTDLAGR